MRSPGQRERLGPRIADEGGVVEARDPGGGEAVVDELAVGLVADEVDGAAVFGGFGAQEVRELREVLVAVDRADGIVGRVDDDGGRLGCDGSLDRVDVEHEVACARGYLDGHRTGVARPGFVLGEVRRDGDDFLARQDDGLDGYADGGRGASREVEVAGRVVRAIAAVEVLLRWPRGPRRGRGTWCRRAWCPGPRARGARWSRRPMAGEGTLGLPIERSKTLSSPTCALRSRP